MTLHIRHDGRSFDVDAHAVGLFGNASDADVKRVAARVLDVSVDDLADAVVERVNDAVIVRPAAVYG